MATVEAENYTGIILYWITFALMFASAIGVALISFTKPMAERKHCCESRPGLVLALDTA